MSPIRRPRNRHSLTPRRSCTALPLLAKRLILSFSLQNRSLREESRQGAVKVETQTAPDAQGGGSRRRRASRQGSDGVRHNNITNRRLTFGPLGSGRLPETLGDQMPAQNFTCQHNSASRRKNQSAARQSFTKLKYLHSIRDI